MAQEIPSTKSGTSARIVFLTAFGGLGLGLAAAAFLDLLHVKKNDTVITLAAVTYVAAILVSVGITFTAGGRLRRRLQTRGVRGRARLLGATQTSQRINNLPVVELVLEIDVPGRAPYQVRHLQVMGLESATQLAPGTEHPVVVDRSDPLVVLVEM